MTWVSWRRQRTETLIAAAILVLLAAVLVPTGIQMANAYDHDGLSACLGQSTTGVCNQAVQSFISRFEGLGNLVAWFTVVPGLIGVLLAAPFVVELENGTYRLAWTQSITRGRWIATKLGVAVGAALVAALALIILVTWWRTPFVHLNGRMASSEFDFEGTVALGYTLFALGLGLAVGVVWRRAVPAMVVAFAGYMAARIFVDTWLRQHLVTPLQATWSVTRRSEPASLYHAWVITEGPSDKLGHQQAAHLFAAPCPGPGGPPVPRVKGACLSEHGANYMHAVYEPATRFWLLQGVETALFGGIALVLILFAAWWTHQRTA
jgi:hypothetical protein